MRESDYPYENAKRQCRTDRSKIVVKVTGGRKLGIFSEQALQDALVNYGPLSIGMRLYFFRNIKHDVIIIIS